MHADGEAGGRRLLTIAIPTFNRSAKVVRAVRMFIEQIEKAGLAESVGILVSNNASSDDTAAVMESLAATRPECLAFVTQPANLGFDGNVAFLYEHCRSRYMWLFGDDDLPLEGAVERVVTVLRDVQPQLLLFSFNQPPDQVGRQFQFAEHVHCETDPRRAIELVMRYTKISIFVYECSVAGQVRQELAPFIGSYWYYIGLAFSVLRSCPAATVAVVSTPLAQCDPDFRVVAYSPQAVRNIGQAVRHPFVSEHAPELPAQYDAFGYVTAIGWCLAQKTRAIVAERPEEYERFLRELPWRFDVLTRHPVAFAQLILMKLGLTRTWLALRRILGRGR